jgi:hypothetical protein
LFGQIVILNTSDATSGSPALTAAGAPVTTIAQTIVGPDGNPAAGQMLIRISTACRTQSAYVGRETIVVKFSAIVNNFSVKLVPNDADGCRGTNYSVARLLTGGQQESATWVVPTTSAGTTVSVDSVETSVSQPLPSWVIQWQQLSQGGAQVGETPVYNGLSWLPGYPTGATFVDAETPGGTLDGVNATFTLAGTPNPPASLTLWRNGLTQKPGLDFSLSGSTITLPRRRRRWPRIRCWRPTAREAVARLAVRLVRRARQVLRARRARYQGRLDRSARQVPPARRVRRERRVLPVPKARLESPAPKDPPARPVHRERLALLVRKAPSG